MRFDAVWMQVGYLALAVGLRAWLQKRRTGSSGIVGLGVQAPADRVVLGLAVAAVGLMALSLISERLGLGPVSALSLPGVRAAGYALFGGGALATFLAQLAMGDSWRIGVSQQESTQLVTGGPFGWVRNPIYTAMLVAQGGVALVLASVPALLGWAAIWLALEVQVRWVEEPHLIRAHGSSYRDYTSRVGRFLPRLGLS